MEILNTIQGTEIMAATAFSWWAFGIILLGVAIIAWGVEDNSVGAFLFGLGILVIGILMTCNGTMKKPTGQFEPTRYEVKINDPNYVIDATKYKIVEKRDKIILLEEIK